MPTNRRQFLKKSAGAVTVSLFLPELLFGRAPQSAADGRKLVIIGLMGGNDCLNSVVPFTNSHYYQHRPDIALRESDLRDAQGQTTLISNELGLHPALVELKAHFNAGRVAIINGVGSVKANLSHFDMMDQWHLGDPNGKKRDGWIGRYLQSKYAGATGIPAMALRSTIAPLTLRSDFGVPTVSNYNDYGIVSDALYPAEITDVLKAFTNIYDGLSMDNGVLGEATRIGIDGIRGALRIRSVTQDYRSTVVYPVNSPISDALKMVAQALFTIPEVQVLYVEMNGFDTHARQIENRAQRTVGLHATLLSQFSQAVDAFYRDLVEHSLADSTVILGWSEFSRRVIQNASNGSDHGNAGTVFVIGNPVKGAIYGGHPSMAAADLDAGGNMKVQTDFRSVYATILDRWLSFDSRAILDERFDDLGFFN